LFFNELEKKSRIDKNTLRSAYHRLVKKGLIIIDGSGTPHLSDRALEMLPLYSPQKLKNSKLMVIFDIPEEVRFKRRKLRLLLRELRFEKVQQSVWITSYDCIKYLAAEVKDNNLDGYIQIYEVSKINIQKLQ
jgi:CRISPR-associated endonuclease Cas2